MYEDEDLQEIHEDIIELDADISVLRKDLNNISASVEGSGENVTLNGTAEARFKTPPLPMGNSEQVQYSGKQLIPFTNQDFTLNEVRHYVQNGTLYLNGTTTTETNQRNELYKSNFSMTLPAGTYYFKRGTSNIPMYIIKYDDNTNIVTNEGQFTLEETTQVYFGIYLYQRTLNNEKIDCQLELGNSATSYEPYTFGQAPNPNFEVPITNVTGDVEVKVQNKNLFDKENASYSADNYVKNNNGEEIYNAGSGYTTSFIKVKPNTNYTISGKITTNDLGGRIYFYDINKSWLSRSNSFSGINANFTFSTPADCNYIQFSYVVSAFDSNTIQIEEGSTASDYVEHKEQTFTFPLGNEKLMLGDYLADDGIHHVRGQVELNQNNIGVVLAVSTYNSKSLATIQRVQLGMIKNYNVNTALISTYKEETNLSNIASGKFSTTADNTSIWIFDDRFTDLATARNLLLGTIIEYELAQEQTIPYTSAQQEVYNQIKQALSYEEQTNISSNTIALFNVKAFKNMNTSIESLQSRIELLKGRS